MQQCCAQKDGNSDNLMKTGKYKFYQSEVIPDKNVKLPFKIIYLQIYEILENKRNRQGMKFLKSHLSCHMRTNLGHQGAVRA